MKEENNVIFREVQRFHQWWLRLINIGTPVFIVSLFGYGMVQQLVFGKPWGDRPMSDIALLVTGICAILFGIAIFALLASTKLITEVRRDGLYIRYVPFHRSFRRIPLENVVRCESRTYRPIREYGGWGIRWARKGRAYNVTGNRGVRIDYADGRHILIGSHKADELAEAVRQRLSPG